MNEKQKKNSDRLLAAALVVPLFAGAHRQLRLRRRPGRHWMWCSHTIPTPI